MAAPSRSEQHSPEAIFRSPAPFVWINGFPGVGKLTISKEVIRLCGSENAMLIDNHQLIDPVAAKYQRDDPEYNPARRRARQQAFDRWLTNEAEHHRLIIFTDFLSKGKIGRSVAADYLAVANASGRPFVPIYLICDGEENVRRSLSAERAGSGTTKLVDAPLLRQIMSEDQLFVFDLPSELRMDVTGLTPSESANKLVDHISTVSRG